MGLGRQFCGLSSREPWFGSQHPTSDSSQPLWLQFQRAWHFRPPQVLTRHPLQLGCACLLWEKSALNNSEDPLHVKNHCFPAAFKIRFMSLAFNCLGCVQVWIILNLSYFVFVGILQDAELLPFPSALAAPLFLELPLCVPGMCGTITLVSNALFHFHYLFLPLALENHNQCTLLILSSADFSFQLLNFSTPGFSIFRLSLTKSLFTFGIFLKYLI